MRFADRARRLAGLAAVLAGWRPRDFWAATPEELETVVDALAGGRPARANTGDLARLQGMFPDG